MSSVFEKKRYLRLSSEYDWNDQFYLVPYTLHAAREELYQSSGVQAGKGPGFKVSFKRWRGDDSNLGHLTYKASALSTRFLLLEKKSVNVFPVALQMSIIVVLGRIVIIESYIY